MTDNKLCAKPWPGFPTSYFVVVFMLNRLRWEVIVRFVDIGETIDDHQLKLSFLKNVFYYKDIYHDAIWHFKLIIILVTRMLIISTRMNIGYWYVVLSVILRFGIFKLFFNNNRPFIPVKEDIYVYISPMTLAWKLNK